MPASTTYTDIGQALYDLMDDLDITAIYPEGWGLTANYPLKQITTWPAFEVVPAEDAEDDLDSLTDDDRVTYWVTVLDSYEEAATAEGNLRRLVDLLRDAVRREKGAATPLGGAAYTLGSLKGQWIADVEGGLRGYRLSVEAKVAQDLG